MYIIFAGTDDKPCGGLRDYQEGLGRFKTVDLAKRALGRLERFDWWQIVKVADDELFMADEGRGPNG